MASDHPVDDADGSLKTSGSIGSVVVKENAEIRGPLIAGGVHGNVHYHEHYSSGSPSCASHEDLSDVLASLKAMLRSKHRKVEIPKLPWLEDWYLPFEDYYVDITMISEKTEERRNVLLEDLFKPSENKSWVSSRILIEGNAGYGKTTLASKLCYDFGKGESEYIRQFDLVLCFKLREFEDSLDKMICKSLNLHTYSSEMILNVVNRYQSKVLLIMDGFEDLEHSKYELVIPLLTSKQLPQATVIVTSRLGHTHHASDGVSCINHNTLRRYFDRRLEICGVQGENVNRFLQLYLKGESERKKGAVKLLLWTMFGVQFDDFHTHKFKRHNKELEKETRSHESRENQAKNVFECPLFLLLLVVVTLETDLELLRTRTDVYKLLLNFIVRRTLYKRCRSDQIVDLFVFDRDNPPTYVCMIEQFGSFSLDALTKKQTSFTREEILLNCGKDDSTSHLGIFTQNDTKCGVREKVLFVPLHLSLMEFCAAYHLWYILTSNSLRFLTSYGKMVQFLPNLLGITDSLIFPFLIGICKQQLTTLFSTLASVQKEYYWLKCYSRCRSLITESQLQMDDLATILLPFVPVTWNMSYFNYDDLNTSGLLTETVLQAAIAGRIQCFVQDTNFTIDIKRSFVKGTMQFVDPDHKSVLRAYESAKWEKLSFVLRSTKNTKLITKLIKATNYKELSFSLMQYYVDRQTAWLLSESAQGFLEDAYLCFLQCICSEQTVCDSLKNLTALIRKEKVKSLKVTFEGKVPTHEWEEFVFYVNQALHLTELNIFIQNKEAHYFQLQAVEGKKWRKLELKGGIVLQEVEKLSSLHIEQLMLNVKVDVDLVKSIYASNTIKCLKLPPHDQYDDTTNHALENLQSTSLIVQSLDELFIDFTVMTSCRCVEFNSFGYLCNIQVLALECSNVNGAELSLYHQRAIENILLTLSHECPNFKRLELWMVRKSTFFSSVLKFLHRGICQNGENMTSCSSSQHEVLKLPVLLLFFEDETHGLPALSEKLLKELLFNHQLEQLWLGTFAGDFLQCLQNEKSANIIRLVQQFYPPSDGFLYELCGGEDTDPYLRYEGSAWWETNFKIIKISMF